MGFSLTIPPGPMNAFIASQTVRSVRNGMVAGAGAMSADGCLGGLVFVFRSIVDLDSFARGIYILGAAVMVLYAALIIRMRSDSTPKLPSNLRIYSQALLLGIGNPFQILWWLTAGLAFAFLGGLLLFVGLFGAIAVWVCVFPLALHRGVRGRAALESSVVWISTALLLGFAGYFVFLAW